MVDGTEKTRALEEAVRLLESVKVDPHLISELDFDGARIDAHIATAISAARAALSAILERQKDNR